MSIFSILLWTSILLIFQEVYLKDNELNKMTAKDISETIEIFCVCVTGSHYVAQDDLELYSPASKCGITVMHHHGQQPVSSMVI
jgi:hypothetical protein